MSDRWEGRQTGFGVAGSEWWARIVPATNDPELVGVEQDVVVLTPAGLAEVERAAAAKALTDAAESYEGHLTEPELPMEDQPSPMARHYKSTAVRLRTRAEAYRQERGEQ